MKKLIYILTLTLFLGACVQTNKKSESNTTKIKVDSAAKVQKKAPTPIDQASLDKIEKENSKKIKAAGDNVNKAFVLEDGSIQMNANMRSDHRFFGYSNPDTKSERLFLFSVFTNDVNNNPFGCKLGSYYGTIDIENFKLKYLETIGKFVKAVAIDKSNNKTILYFEKKWIEI